MVFQLPCRLLRNKICLSVWMLNIPFIHGISEDINNFVQSTCNKYQMFSVYCLRLSLILSLSLSLFSLIFLKCFLVIGAMYYSNIRHQHVIDFGTLHDFKYGFLFSLNMINMNLAHPLNISDSIVMRKSGASFVYANITSANLVRLL